MRSWLVEGVGYRIASPEVAVDIRPAYLPYAAAAADVACAAPRPGNRLVDTVTLSMLLLHYLGPCHVPCVLLEGSLLLVLCQLLGVGRLCLPLLRWGSLGHLPLLHGGCWGPFMFMFRCCHMF